MTIEAIARGDAPPATTLNPDTVMRVDGLSTSFIYKNRTARAVREVTFTLGRGKTLAIVGESGSGKSVTSLSILHLLAAPGRIVSGRILYRTNNGEVIDLAKANARTMRGIRGREISMIFQEPMTSLNPLFTVGDQVAEMVRLHRRVGKAEAWARALEYLKLVEIPSAEKRMDDYPHQMSGGMRQRVMIAIALACEPALLIADEPTTALDVTIQAQILDLLRRLQREIGMSILFITHNMGVVAEVADEVVVMYGGEVIEQGDVKALFARPRHPYTEGLLASIPDARRDIGPDGLRSRLHPIPGTVPSIYAMPSGCTFAPRCPVAEGRCGAPMVLEPAAPGHLTRCWKRRAEA